MLAENVREKAGDVRKLKDLRQALLAAKRGNLRLPEAPIWRISARARGERRTAAACGVASVSPGEKHRALLRLFGVAGGVPQAPNAFCALPAFCSA